MAVLGTTDPAIAQAVEYNRQVAHHEQQADQHRAWRDQVVRDLRSSDSATWTVKALASGLGVSITTIRRILK